MLADERVLLRVTVMDDTEHRHRHPLDRPGIGIVLHATAEDLVEHADVTDADIRHDPVIRTARRAELCGHLGCEPCAHPRSGHDQVLGLEEIDAVAPGREVCDDRCDDLVKFPHESNTQRHRTSTVRPPMVNRKVAAPQGGLTYWQKGVSGFPGKTGTRPGRAYSARNVRRSFRRASFEKTSTGGFVGRRRARWMIRHVVCWLYSASVTAQPSRPARAVRPERCR